MAKQSLNRNANQCECKANLMNAKSPTRMNRETTFAKKSPFLGAREEEPVASRSQWFTTKCTGQL